MRRTYITLCLCGSMMLSMTCAQTETKKELEPAVCAEAREKDSQIQNLIQDIACTSVSQCKAIAYGFKACGGPERYLIYSTQSADQNIVTNKVTEYNGLRESCVRAEKMASDCSTPFEPTLSCVLSLCVGTTP